MQIAKPPHASFDPLKGLSVSELFDQLRTGELTREQLTTWARCEPDSVPLVNDEFPWIALDLADLD